MVRSSMSSARSEIISSTPTKALFSNENNHNGSDAAAAAKERFSKRSRTSTPLQNSCGDNHSECGVHEYLSRKQVRQERAPNSEIRSEINSCTASSVVSVSQMRGWLNDFGEQNKAHFNKTNTIGKQPQGVSLSKPHRSKLPSSSIQQTAMVVSKNPPGAHDSKYGPARTPVRFKPRFQKMDVEATNDGYASVQKLSAWLADDPTSAKKVTHVRKGINVISKSRAFEKDMADVIIEENDIRKGSVVEKKHAILNHDQSGKETQEGDEWETASASVGDKKKWLRSAFQRESRTMDEQSDISVMSVSDKKKWLQGAFSKMDDNKTPKRSGADKFKEPVPTQVPCAEERKKKYEEERDETVESRGRVSPFASPTPSFEHRDELCSTEVTAARINKSVDGIDPTHALVRSLLKEKSQRDGPEEEAVGFEAARRRLVKRSEQNGNAVAVVSKVQLRKQKFEKLGKERVRGTGPKGLLKPSWETGDSSEGRSSTSYSKTFVEDIAPKRSFEELP